jgi:hypothetical protein
MRKFSNQENTANNIRADKANGRISRPTTSEGYYGITGGEIALEKSEHHMLIISWFVAENRQGFHCGQGNYSDVDEK